MLFGQWERVLQILKFKLTVRFVFVIHSINRLGPEIDDSILYEMVESCWFLKSLRQVDFKFLCDKSHESFAWDLIWTFADIRMELRKAMVIDWGEYLIE